MMNDKKEQIVHFIHGYNVFIGLYAFTKFMTASRETEKISLTIFFIAFGCGMVSHFLAFLLLRKKKVKRLSPLSKEYILYLIFSLILGIVVLEIFVFG